MAGLAVTFAAFIVWGFLGSIPETVDISGTTLIREDGAMAVYSFLPIDETRTLSESMSVRISPDYAPREQFGYIFGSIRSISRSPVTAEMIRSQFGNDAQFLTLPPGNLIEVVITLEMTADGNPKWSKARGADIDVLAGSTCLMTVITGERRPVDLMFR
jgi:hypothetical protein